MTTPGQRWQPSPAARAIGDASTVRYTSPSVYREGEPTQFAPGTGIVEFRNWVERHFTGFSTVGGIRRSPAKEPIPGRQRDQHEEGRAVDFMMRDHGGAEGDRLAEWLLTNHAAIGLQGLIWAGTEWYPSHPPRVDNYTGTNPHTDHVHVELSPEAANLPATVMRARLDAIPLTTPAPAAPPQPSSGAGSWLAALALAAAGGYAGYRWQKGRRW
jgi:hypothetical protein